MPICNNTFLHNYQDAGMSSKSVVEIIGWKYGLFVTNNVTVLVVGKYFL